MKHKQLLFVGVSLALLVSTLMVLPRLADGSSPSPSAEIIFEGIARDANGDPVGAGITVECYRGSEFKDRETTNQNGEYEIRDWHSEYPSDNYTIYIFKGQANEGKCTRYHTQGSVTTVNVKENTTCPAS